MKTVPSEPTMDKPSARNMAPCGRALADFLAGRARGPLLLRDGTSEDTLEVPIRHFFRDQASFSAIDRAALDLCRGRILDLGAGAGPHSLALQHAGFETCAVDVSPLACRVLRQRGVRKVLCCDLFDLPPQHADTLLLMMNGLGVVGDLAGLDRFLALAHRLTAPRAQILVDSVEPHTPRCPSTRPSSEPILRLRYGETPETCCRWLTLGADELATAAGRHGWSSRVIVRDPSGEYLAQLVAVDGHREAVVGSVPVSQPEG